MKRMAIVTALAIVGCAASSEAPSGPCEKRSGTYRTTYTKQSGTCPNFTESISTITEQPTKVDPPCTGTISYSPDNCRVTLDSSCPEPNLGAGYAQRWRGAVDWNVTGSRGAGNLEVIVTRPDGTVVCNGVYGVTDVRQ
jgi:hypothetical protein